MGALLAVCFAGTAGSFAITWRADPGDFGVFYAAGRAALEHHDPYDISGTTAIAAAVEGRERSAIYLNPPPFTIIAAGVGALPFALSRLAWLLAIAGAEVVAAYLVAVILDRRPTGAGPWLLIVAAALAFSPFRNAFGLGQVDPLIACAGLAAVTSMARGGFRGGVLLAASLLKPQVLGLPGLILCATSPRRFAGGVITAVVAVTAGTLLAANLGLRVGTLGAWATQLASQHPGTASIGPYLVISALLILTAAALRVGAHQPGPPEPVRAFAAGAALTAAAGPLLYLHLQTDVVLMLPIAIVVSREVTRESIRWWSAIGLGVLTGVASGDALQAITHYAGWKHALVPLVITMSLFGATGLSRPRLARPLLLAALVNATLVLAPLSPDFYDWLGQALGLGVGAWLLLPDVLAAGRRPSVLR